MGRVTVGLVAKQVVDAENLLNQNQGGTRARRRRCKIGVKGAPILGLDFYHFIGHCYAPFIKGCLSLNGEALKLN